MQIHQKFKLLRDHTGITQIQIAEVLGITRPQYYLYETGKREMPLHHLVTLAKYYNVSLDYLVGLTDEEKGGA